MDTTESPSYLLHARMPHPAPHREHSGPPHSAPAVLSPPQPNHYNPGPGPRLPRVDYTSNAGRGSGHYYPSDYRYSGFNASSASPSSVAASSMHEPIGANDHYPGSLGSPTLPGGQGLMGPKRAYRQRRKDPSCDACRERKVKCDATETTSCSECVTRSVKCQFTKETNRRMSSIKQVQDLQLQLADAKRTISQLESMIQTPRRPGSGSPPNHSARLSELANLAAKGRIIPLLGDFDSVRSSIQTCSRGIFKIPPLYRPFTPAVLIATSEVTLPAKDIADALLSQFYRYYNAHILFIDWPCFIAQIEKCYANGSVQGVSPVWASTFFVALACGTLQSVERDKPGMNPDKDGIQYLVVGSRLSNSWTDSLSINHARTSILISTFLQEQNLRSAGWSWLGGGVRMLDEIGLNLDSGVWSGQEGEFRRSVYWAIFSYDRLLTLDGRPLTVYEDDLEVPWPNIPDFKNPSDTHHVRTMQYVIPVIRMIPQLKKTLKSTTISRTTLTTWDEFFHSIQSSYPEVLQPTSEESFEPHLFHAVFPLQAARHILFRHNLSPQCSTMERKEALDRCLSVAYDTLAYVKRVLRPSSPVLDKLTPPHSQEGLHTSIRFHANNFICLHLWRTTLIFSLVRDFEAALICVQLSSILSDMRPINTACGRFLSVFLTRTVEHLSQGPSATPIDETEEFIAYASGDLQADADNAWIWNGTTNTVSTGQTSKETATAPPSSEETTPHSRHVQMPKTSLLTETEKNDWGGWERVEKLLSSLIELNAKHSGGARRRREGTSASVDNQGPSSPNERYHQPAHNPSKRIQLDKMTAGAQSSERPTPMSQPSVGASRISIANII